SPVDSARRTRPSSSRLAQPGRDSNETATSWKPRVSITLARDRRFLAAKLAEGVCEIRTRERVCFSLRASFLAFARGTPLAVTRRARMPRLGPIILSRWARWGLLSVTLAMGTALVGTA